MTSRMTKGRRPQLGLSRRQDARDFAADAVAAMRREGQSPREVMHAFERPWFRLADPDWDTVAAEVAIAFVQRQRWRSVP